MAIYSIIYIARLPCKRDDSVYSGIASPVRGESCSIAALSVTEEVTLPDPQENLRLFNICNLIGLFIL